MTDGPRIKLAGVTEVAAALGVSVQRVSQLRAKGTLPEPLDELACGPVWLMAEIKVHALTRDTRPGRRPTKRED